MEISKSYLVHFYMDPTLGVKQISIVDPLRSGEVKVLKQIRGDEAQTLYDLIFESDKK